MNKNSIDSVQANVAIDGVGGVAASPGVAIASNARSSWRVGKALIAMVGAAGVVCIVFALTLEFEPEVQWNFIEHWAWSREPGAVLTVALLALVAMSSFLSGVLGLAGGILLIGGLVLLLDLTTAMLLASAVLVATTLWRLVSWRRYADWAAIATMAVGEVLAFMFLVAIGFVPDKAVVLIVLGAPPLLINFVPTRFWPNLDHRSGQFACGVAFGVATLVGGAGAAVTDMFYQKSKLNRLQVVATKSGMAVPICALRAILFGWAAYAATGTIELAISLQTFFSAIVVGVFATWLGGRVLQRGVTDRRFLDWNWRLAIAFSLFFVVQGIWLSVLQ